jgi:hypothetical protein
MRCSKCHRPVRGTTACTCGGLIEAEISFQIIYDDNPYEDDKHVLLTIIEGTIKHRQRFRLREAAEDEKRRREEAWQTKGYKY